MTTVAAIDCGTNSIKVLIGRVGEGALEVLERDSRVVRLGEGVDRTGMLAEGALARTFAAVDEFAQVIRGHGVPPELTRFCATSATRDAGNSTVFTEGVRRRLHVDPEVLSGAEEAALVFAGAVTGLGRAEGSAPTDEALVVDIGGGSTELVQGRGKGEPRKSVSMDIGSVRLHERHLHSDPPSADQVDACVADIGRHLDEADLALDEASLVIGTSGTIKTVACGVLDLDGYDREAFDRAELANQATRDFGARLLAMTVEQRRALPFMHPGRADVIGAGALIWSLILARVEVDTHLVSEADILHGIAAAIAT